MKGHWKKDEDDFIKANYKKIGYREIGELVGKSGDQVYRRLKTLGFKKFPHRDWTKKEINFLAANGRKTWQALRGCFFTHTSSRSSKGF